MSDTDHHQPVKKNNRLVILPSTALAVGCFLGLTRGARRASLQFLAEHAHHPPTTKQGWYFYNKTKNYKVLLAGLRSGGREGVRLGSVALAWVGIEEGLDRLGIPYKTLGASLGTAGTFSALYRLSWATSRSVLLLSGIVGLCLEGMMQWREQLQVGSSDGSGEGNGSEAMK